MTDPLLLGVLLANLLPNRTYKHSNQSRISKVPQEVHSGQFTSPSLPWTCARSCALLLALQTSDDISSPSVLWLYQP